MIVEVTQSYDERPCITTTSVQTLTQRGEELSYRGRIADIIPKENFDGFELNTFTEQQRFEVVTFAFSG